MGDGSHDLPRSFRQLIERLVDYFKVLDKEINELERWYRENEASVKLAEIPGISPITASALAHPQGMQRISRAAGKWQHDLVPQQHSTGGKSTLPGISKRGDTYLRILLIHGARSRIAQTKTSQPGRGFTAF